MPVAGNKTVWAGGAKLSDMAERISQADLRDRSDEIVRALEKGRSYLLTRDGRPVGEMNPVNRYLVDVKTVIAGMADAPPVNYKKFREDLDRILRIDSPPLA